MICVLVEVGRSIRSAVENRIYIQSSSINKAVGLKGYKDKILIIGGDKQ